MPSSLNAPQLHEFVNQTDVENNCALHAAADNGNVNLIELLLRYGAEPLCKNSLDETPRFKAQVLYSTRHCLPRPISITGALFQYHGEEDAERLLSLAEKAFTQGVVYCLSGVLSGHALR